MKNLRIEDFPDTPPKIVYVDRPVEKTVYVDKIQYVDRTQYVDRPTIQYVDKIIPADTSAFTDEISDLKSRLIHKEEELRATIQEFHATQSRLNIAAELTIEDLKKKKAAEIEHLKSDLELEKTLNRELRQEIKEKDASLNHTLEQLTLKESEIGEMKKELASTGVQDSRLIEKLNEQCKELKSDKVDLQSDKNYLKEQMYQLKKNYTTVKSKYEVKSVKIKELTKQLVDLKLINESLVTESLNSENITSMQNTHSHFGIEDATIQESIMFSDTSNLAGEQSSNYDI